MANKTGHFGFVQAVARTDVGKKRKNNEDAYGIYHEAGVFCVADGMGGGDDGEIASAAVVNGLEDGLSRMIAPQDGAYAVADVADAVERSLTKASGWIFNRTRTKKLSGCGSTFVGFALDATDPGNALAIHAGDSRLYLLHGRSIKQITHDHSVAEMIGAKDESKVNPMFRSMVMNAIGIRAKADPERTPFKVVAGDRILVCSDGLSRMVPDKKILAISRKNEKVDAAADALIAAALDAGGIDNVTVVLAEIGELPEPLPALAAPAAERSDDSATESGDRATGSTGSGSSTDSSQTMSTMAPTVAGEDMLAPEEEDEEPVTGLESRTWAPSKKAGKSKGPIMMVGFASLLLVGVIVAALVLKKGDSAPKNERITVKQALQKEAVPRDDGREGTRDHTVAAKESLPTEKNVVKPIRPVVKPAAVATNAVKVARPALTNVVKVVTPVVTNTVKVVTPVVTNVVKTVKPVETNGAAVVRVPEPFEGVVKVCEGETLVQFCLAIRRLEGADNHDLVSQMKRFENSAHFCSRMRSKDGAVRAVVDLKYCLTTAGKARKSLETSNKAIARKLLTWWDTLVDAEPSEPKAMAAAVQLMKSLPEMTSR